MSAQRVGTLFRALSDLTRLRILHLIRSQEICVGDLVTILKAPQPTISRHLSYLRRAGLVATRRAGQWSYYSLAPVDGRFHRTLLDCLNASYREIPALAADTARLAALKKAGGCCPR